MDSGAELRRTLQPRPCDLQLLDRFCLELQVADLLLKQILGGWMGATHWLQACSRGVKMSVGGAHFDEQPGNASAFPQMV